MVRFDILHGIRLTGGKKLAPLSAYVTDDETELAELRKLEQSDGACKEFKPEPPKMGDDAAVAPTDPAEDLALMKGIANKTVVAKLAEMDISTQSGLKAALVDKEKKAKLTEVLGEKAVEKMDAFFAPKDQK